ncbi:MAG: hypothetical protein GX613_02285 [Chloroflexi bacterium]|nr:hypothetical protein [Chloroflexota bacterium]
MKPQENAARFSGIRDTVIAIVLLAIGIGIVAIYQIEASNAEEVSIASNTGGAASQMLNRGTGDTAGTGEETALPDDPLERWAIGPHASTYVVSAEGTNDTCNRCHDPINYVPSMEDMPASCSMCKFEVEPPPPLIEEANAHMVDCKVCHRVDKSGTVLAGNQWLEVAAIEQYAEVESVNQLCQYCHTGAGVEGHADILLDGAHADLACNDCHDEHAMTATCTSSGCHESLEEHPGHDTDHATVHCVACHDTSGMEVGPDEARGGQWVTLAGEGDDAFPHLSHALSADVSCERCHVEILPGVYK